MANVKISALNSATTPLAGTETIPIVQGGETKKVAINNINTLKGFHSPFPLASGQKTTAVLNGTLSSSLSFAERAIAVPYMPSQNITTSDLYINVSALASGALARVYIYSDLNLYPDQLLYQSADINCSTTGTKTLTTTFNFVAGQVYWLVTHTSAGTQPQFTSSSSVTPSLPIFRLSGVTGFQMGQVISTQITFANPVPTTFPAGGTLSTIQAPIVGITKA
jgi:hypothetical protein